MSTKKKPQSRPASKTRAKVIHLEAFRQPTEILTDKLINCLWHVAKGSLWMNCDYSSEEISHFKELLAQHFYNGKNSKQNFRELVQRIFLTKFFELSEGGSYPTKPQNWLSIHYPKGLSQESEWQDKLNEIKKEEHLHDQGIMTLSKGILKYHDCPDQIVFNRYRRLLIKQKQYDLLEIFYRTIINLQFSK